MSKIAEVKFKVAINEDATDDEIRDWLEFELNYCPDMPCGNPLENEPVVLMNSSLELKIEEVD